MKKFVALIAVIVSVYLLVILVSYCSFDHDSSNETDSTKHNVEQTYGLLKQALDETDYESALIFADEIYNTLYYSDSNDTITINRLIFLSYSYFTICRLDKINENEEAALKCKKLAKKAFLKDKDYSTKLIKEKISINKDDYISLEYDLMIKVYIDESF